MDEFKAKRCAGYRLAPYLFVTEAIGEEPRWWQSDCLLDISRDLIQGRKFHEIHARTCHTAGKTKLAAWLFLWWMMTRPGARALTTSDTWLQIENLIWKEINSCFERLKDRGFAFGRMLGTEYQISPEWFGYGASSDKPARLEGAHSNTAAMRIVDEMKTVDWALMKSTQGLLHAPESFDIGISTPWTKRGPFYEIDRDGGPELTRIVVDLQAMIANGVPGSQQAWDKMAKICGGEASPEFLARARARYIEEDASFGSVDVAALDDCMAKEPAYEGDVTVGLDVARSTDGDESVITVMMGSDCVEQLALRIRDTHALASRCVERARYWLAESITVDAIGVGGGPVDTIRAWGWTGKVHEFIQKARPNNPVRFDGRAAEAAWSLVERINAREIALPKDAKLRSQLLQIRFDPVAGGKISLNKCPKFDSMGNATGFTSPDRFDSLMIATAPPIYTDGRGLLEWMTAQHAMREKAA